MYLILYLKNSKLINSLNKLIINKNNMKLLNVGVKMFKLKK
jgi:hypothetical protein